MSSSAPRGRGRGRGSNRSSASATPAAQAGPAPSRSPSPAPVEDDEQMEDADEASTPAARRSTRGATASTSASASGSRARPVGGLLGESEYARKEGGSGAAAKRKFVPNMKRKTRVVKDDEDDEDVKMEDDFKSRRGPPKPRAARQEQQMTATGPMAQGPGGAPKSFGAKVFHGAAGAGVMNASREGRLRGQFEEHAGDEDDSDLEDGSDAEGGSFKVFARELDLIGEEDEMAPITLPRDPKVVGASEERRRLRKEKRVKEEAKPAIKPEPMDDDVLLSSAAGTPALEVDSKTVTSGSATPAMLLGDEDDKKDIKLDDEPDLRRDFDVPDNASDPIYMFQFPRRFPKLVPEAQLAAATNPEIKMEDGTAPSSAGGRKKQPPEWGRTGARANKASRWAGEEGQIGELLVHESGKVTLVINGDLSYEVLPAAHPSFLQEVVVLDHVDPSAAATSADEPKPKPTLLTMGQTSKKFMVVPQIDSLLEKVEQQEREEKRAAAALKSAIKKEKK